MEKQYLEELVYIESEDGIALEGVVIRPTAESPRPLAVLWVHGLTGRFYGTSAVRIGRSLAGQGFTLVTGNNRGHHFGSVLRDRNNEPILGGGGWERFEESPRDVGAWVAFTERLGFSRLVLLGHSLGSLKVVYYQANRQDPRVVGLIAASPPVRAGRTRPDLLAQARKMVAEGRGRDLLPWDSMPAGAGTTSAQTYLSRVEVGVDQFGVDDPDPPVSKIRCPILALYGTDEAWVGGVADLEMIRRNATSAAHVETRMIDGADHVYTGHEDEVGAVVGEWLRRLL
jgi:pimeloyl-ACP methyl ester carboxylesterase